MPQKDDLVGRLVARRTLPARIAREVAAGAERLSPSGMFGPEFYEEVRRQAAQWQNPGMAAGKLAVLMPAGYFAAQAGYHFPDLDIAQLGIGAHRFFLYHSGIGVWVLKKLHQAAMAYVGEPQGGLGDLVVRKILGVVLAAGAFGVGVHLLLDVFDPKAVIFPFFGSLVDGTLVEDRVWLLANALWCFQMAQDLFVLALGEELDWVKEEMAKFFEPVSKEGGMLFLAALDKLTREELLDLATAYQAFGLWTGMKETFYSGLRWLGLSDHRPMEEELKKARQELEDLSDQGLRRRLYNAIADLAGVSEADRADPEKVARQALVAAAGHLGIKTELLSPAELERQVCEKSIERMMEQLKEKLKQISPEEEARLEEHLRELLDKLSAGEREAIRQELGIEQLTAQALLTVLKTGTLTLLTLGALNMAGFGVYLAAATGLKAMALLFGVALPFKAYLATSTILGVLLGPVGWMAAAGFIGLVGYFQKSKIDGEILTQLITTLHYRLARE